MQPSGVDISTVRPSEGAEFDTDPRKKISVRKWRVDTWTLGILYRREIGYSSQTITEGDGEPMVRQERDRMNTPRCSRRYSSGGILFGACLV